MVLDEIPLPIEVCATIYVPQRQFVHADLASDASEGRGLAMKWCLGLLVAELRLLHAAPTRSGRVNQEHGQPVTSVGA